MYKFDYLLNISFNLCIFYVERLKSIEVFLYFKTDNNLTLWLPFTVNCAVING